MSGIFGAFGGWLPGGFVNCTVGDPPQSSAQASALTHKDILDASVRIVRQSFNQNPILARLLLPPGIYWTQRINRQWTVEIVR